MGLFRKAQPPIEVQLSERDARILAKYEYRAKQFDEMIKICCCWIGYDVLLDFIPIVGKVISLCFSLSMYRLSCQCELPASLRRTMLYHITVDFVLGLVPILGIVLTALYRANTKNARLLRRFLYQRAAQQQQQQQPMSSSTPYTNTTHLTQSPPMIQQPEPVAVTPMTPASFVSPQTISPPVEKSTPTPPPPTPPRRSTTGTSTTTSNNTNTPPPLPSRENTLDSKPPPTPPR
ncbi:hypothetical protein BDA99DRAFT_562642 [Phascolomyces articulosus]|uniref:Uncharacterized protein n=1 Tax=Phascolomyces articulosus TaxID=60185 RepID=A0AAD5PB17_9FUNG|nr:hypothetical protein BDA99DRAFT_562642 [Phascolomyces articulosus]